MHPHIQQKVNHLIDVLATPISGIDREWVSRVLNAEFGDRVMIQTNGEECSEWLDTPRPEPGVPSEPDDEYEEVK